MTDFYKWYNLYKWFNLLVWYKWKKKILVKDIKVPLLIILALNLVNFVYPLPVILQMIASAIILAFVGCVLSASIRSATYVEIQHCENKFRSRQEEDGFLKKMLGNWGLSTYYNYRSTSSILFCEINWAN